MSRVGNKLIKLHAGVTVTVEENNKVVVKGPKGELDFTFDPEMSFEIAETSVSVKRPSDSIKHKSLHGTTRAVLNNMIEGVANGFTKVLVIEGVGYRASIKGNTLVVNAGYSHLVEMPIPTGLTVTCATPTEITITGIDRQLVGQFAAEVRLVRKPEPYKGKGIRYKTEIIRRKEGKKAK
ncbi:MAG: 50S ribosomal protein L6 [Bacilli bacterium]